MIVVSTKEPVRFTPGWLKGDAAPVFLIRAGSILERGMLEAELAGEHQAGRVFAFELMEAFRTGIETLLADDPDSGQLLDLAASEAAGDILTADEAQMLVHAREVLAEHWHPYRALNARMARRKEIAPIIALRRFLVGWKNVDVPFKRGADGSVSLDLLGKLDPLEMMVAGNHAYGLLYPSEEDQGNSLPPSQSGEGQAISSSPDTSAGAGKSKAGAGKKTRSRASSRTSGL